MTGTIKDFRIGIIGCGRISQAYVQAISETPNLTLAAVMDTRPEAAQSTAEAAGCKAYNQIESLIRDARVDAAIICTPPNTHSSIACDLMDHGLHVLCEKPFAPTIEEAIKMIETAEKRGKILMMASKFRCVEDVIRAKAMIDSGMLGDILFYENSFCSHVNMHGRWNSAPEIAGGGVLIDNGTHSVDIARYLLGPIERVNALEGKRIMNLPVEETATISIQTRDGAMGVIRLSWSINIQQSHYIAIHGSNGAMTIGWQDSKYQHNGHPDWISFGVGYNKIDAFKMQVTNFVDSVKGVASPILTEEDGLASVEVVQAAYRSLQQNNWVDVVHTTQLAEAV